jgi:hypothetical protein
VWHLLSFQNKGLKYVYPLANHMGWFGFVIVKVGVKNISVAVKYGMASTQN